MFEFSQYYAVFKFSLRRTYERDSFDSSGAENTKLTLYGLSRIGRWEEKGKLIRTEHEKGPILACKIHQINVTHTRAFRFIILLHLINQQSLEFLCMYTFYRKYLNYVGVLL